MTDDGVRKHFRLLPAVIAVGAILLAVKGIGLVHDARAQDLVTHSSAAAHGAAIGGSDIVADDTGSTTAEVDVLTSLSKRRAELDAREQLLQTREILLEAAQRKVDEKIARLKDLQGQIEALLAQRGDTEQKEMAELTKSYSSMKPRDAARIFNNLDDVVLLGVSGAMKPDVLGAILAQMQADAAQKLTVKLAGRMKLPDAAPVGSQVAMIPAPTPLKDPPAAVVQQPQSAPSAATPPNAMGKPAGGSSATAASREVMPQTK